MNYGMPNDAEIQILNELRRISQELEALKLKMVQGVNSLDEISSNAGELEDGKIGGWQLEPTKISVGSGENTAGMDSTEGNPAFYAGAEDPNSAPYQVGKDGKLKATGAEIEGDITATTGSIGGWNIEETKISAGTGANHVAMDSGGVNPAFSAGSETPGSAPFRVMKNGDVHSDGDAVFNNITAQGALKASVFVKNLIATLAGGLLVSKSAGKLAVGVTVDTDPFDLDIEDPPSGHEALFEAGDILRLKDGTHDSWLLVSSASDQTTFYRYSCTVVHGNETATYAAGLGVADYGQDGDGFLLMSADDDDGPFYSVLTTSGSPWDDAEEVVRIGNLKNFLDYVLDVYGIGIGDVNASLSYDPVNGLRFSSGSAGGLTIDKDGILMEGEELDVNKIRWKTSDIVFAYIAGRYTDEGTQYLYQQDMILEGPSSGSTRSQTLIRAQSDDNPGASVGLEAVCGSGPISGTNHATITLEGTSGSAYAEIQSSGSIIFDAKSYEYTTITGSPTVASGRYGLYPRSDGFYQKTSGLAATEKKLVTIDALEYPTNAYINPRSFRSNTTLTEYIATAYNTAFMYTTPANAANGDWFISDFLLAAGTANITLMGYTDTTRGKIDYYIDNVLVYSGQDWYTSATFTSKTITGITIADSGLHRLKLLINGHNGSSSDYTFACTWLNISLDIS